MRFTTFEKGGKTHKMISFGEASDRHAFNFGVEKARKIVDAAKAHGPAAVIAALEKLVAEKDANKPEVTVTTEEIVGAEESGATAELPAVAETLL